MTTFPNYGPQLPETYYADESLGRMDPSMSNQFPPFQVSGTPQLRDQSPTPQGPFGANLPRDLQSMIAPYRDMASKFSSPYLMMNKDSWMAQNHPRAAGMIDNALSAVALSKFGAPATAGQNLSAALGGAMEANQMKRQQLMQNAMLPYHMMMPQLEAEHLMAETEAQKSEVPLHQALTTMYGQHGNLFDVNAQRFSGLQPTGKMIPDLKGNPWQEMRDPGMGGATRMWSPTEQRFATPEEELQFHQQGGAGSPNVDYTLSGIQRRMAAGDPTAKADYQRFLDAQGAGAAAHTGGTRSVTQPIEDAEKFRDEQVRQRTADIPSVPSRKEYEQERNAGMSNEDLAYQYPNSKLAQDRRPNETASDYRERKYQESITPMQQQKERQQQEISQYQSSPAWKHGVSFQDWKQNPDAWKTAPTSKAKSTTREYKYDAQGNRLP